MGTRHNITIKHNGKIVLSQYGQWDGYPEGQGKDILNFLLVNGNIDKLKESTYKLRFAEREGKDKKFLEEYDKNAPEWSNELDNRTQEQIEWFNTFVTRDLGAKILYNIIDYDGKEILVFNNEDMSWCEGLYTIDLDEMEFIVEYGRIERKFDLIDLPTVKEFLKNFEKDEE